MARGRCPACDSRTAAWGAINSDGAARVGCHACHDWEAIRQLLRLDAGAGSPPPRFRATPAAKSEADVLCMEQDADDLDAVYRVFARHLPLAAEARRAELARKRRIPQHVRAAMTQPLRSLGRFRGPDDQVARRIVADLARILPRERLRGVPELEARKQGSFVVLRSQREARYLEPWMDEQGRIVALRGYHGKLGMKYRTTAGRSGPMVHVAFGVPRERAAEVPWIFTEAWMKAEVAAHALGVVAVAFAGANHRCAWERGLRIKRRVAPDAPTYIGFDADAWTTNPDIAVAMLELAGLVRRREGRCAGFAAWAVQIVKGVPEPKGIDDAIVAGLEVQLVGRQEFGRYLGPTLDMWESHEAA